MVNQYKPVPDLPAEPTPGLADLALIVHGGAVVLATLANILALRRARVLDGNYGAITVTGDGTVWDFTEDILKLLATFLGTAGGTIPVWDRSGPAWRDLVIGANLTFDGTTLAATGGTPTPPGGSSGQIQFNDAGAFGGVVGLVIPPFSLRPVAPLGFATGFFPGSTPDFDNQLVISMSATPTLRPLVIMAAAATITFAVDELGNPQFSTTQAPSGALGTLVGRLPILNVAGGLVGYTPIYDDV